MKVLLIADTSTNSALGSKIINSANSVIAEFKLEIRTTYTSAAPEYSPSMRSRRGKAFYYLNDKRTFEWRDFQREATELINLMEPDLVIVSNILPLSPGVFRAAKHCNALIVNYLIDNPWNRIHYRRSFIANLALYDHIFTTIKATVPLLSKAGARSSSFLPCAYDQTIHVAADRVSSEAVDILFVGTGANERLPWLRSLSKIPGATRRVRGNNWERINLKDWEKKEAVTGNDYCQAISSAKIVLGLLRKANGDLSTDRSYEIGAIGGCGLYQDTEEHRRILRGYPDEGFFCDPGDLQKKTEILLKDARLQDELRRIGYSAIRGERNTYGDRLRKIVEWAKTTATHNNK